MAEIPSKMSMELSEMVSKVEKASDIFTLAEQVNVVEKRGGKSKNQLHIVSWRKCLLNQIREIRFDFV